MKKRLQILFLFLLTSATMLSQTDEAPDDFRSNPFYRNFDNIPQNEYLDSLANVDKRRKRYHSLYGCFAQLDHHEKNTLFKQQIHLRLRDFSRKLYSENKAVILVGGSGCQNQTEITNINGKQVMIHYVCITDSCVSSMTIEEAKNAFNNETRTLLGWKE